MTILAMTFLKNCLVVWQNVSTILWENNLQLPKLHINQFRIYQLLVIFFIIYLVALQNLTTILCENNLQLPKTHSSGKRFNKLKRT